jgi:hypothetical protein
VAELVTHDTLLVLGRGLGAFEVSALLGLTDYLKLTCWVRGTNPSTLELERARAYQFGEPK